MTPTLAPVSGLDAQQLDIAFPYHWKVDHDLRIVQMGSVLRRRYPQATQGTPLTALFRLLRPQLTRIDRSALAAARDGVVLIESVCDTPLRLRGQLLVAGTGEEGIMFIGSPWLSKLGDLESHNLTLRDFALHDSAMDFLFVHQANLAALDDTRLLARTLKERSQRLDAIFQLSPDGFVAFDEHGKVDYVNPAFHHMTGLDTASLIGKSDGEVETLMGALCESAQQETPSASTDAPERLRRRSERRKTARRTLHLARPRKRIVQRSLRRGEGKAKVLYLRDVTRETEVDRMKSEFLTSAAHELRTPMASVFGFTELLLTRPFDEVTRNDLLRTMHRQSGALIRMLNELLDLARIEARAGKDFCIETQPLRPLIQETVSEFMVPNDMRVVNVTLPDILPDVSVDAGKFRQALTNVLSNAFKYSPGGGQIHLDIVSRPDGRAVGVRVSDEGMGMTAEQLSRAFERFYRADTSGNLPGTGLGLSLVKEVLELMGGHAELQSQPGVGTQATLWLPLRSARRRGQRNPEHSQPLLERI